MKINTARRVSPDTRTGSIQRERDIIKLQYVGKYLNTMQNYFHSLFRQCLGFPLAENTRFILKNKQVKFVKQIVSSYG